MNRGFILYDRFHARFLKPHFRRARMRSFLDQLRPTETTRILDVGGEPDIWRFIDCRSPITMLNLSRPSQQIYQGTPEPIDYGTVETRQVNARNGMITYRGDPIAFRPRLATGTSI